MGQFKFVIGKKYRRIDLHNEYGGSRQSGIAGSSSKPIIFLFTGKSGEKHGYEDQITDTGIVFYTGEGQIGDMQIVRGNKSIVEAKKEGKELHLFQAEEKGFVSYVGQVEYLNHQVRLGFDSNGAERKIIVFELSLDQSSEEGVPGNLLEATEEIPKDFENMSLDELRSLAINQAKPASEKTKTSIQYSRSSAVKIYVKSRANGVCEGCSLPAPFLDSKKRPFLEAHHIRRRSDGGPDHPRWVIAICPNCHRRAHFGQDAKLVNENYAEIVRKKEDLVN